jgi:hypothetical protein
LKAGVVSDETLYFGTIMNIGIPVLFGSVSWNTDFNITQLRFGGGTSINIGKKTRVIFSLNTGKSSKNFSSSDSLKEEIIVKSVLNRIGTGIEYSLSNRFILLAQPVLNRMKTNYTLNSEPASVGSFHANADQYFYCIKPPYTLKNTYTDTSSSNIKTWIGIQVGVLYLVNLSSKKKYKAK